MTVRFRFASALLLGIGLASFVPLAASAGVNGREHRQRERIRAGVADGSLTPREAHRLGRQQLRIEHREQLMRRDGFLGPRERLRLHRSLDRSSRHIYWQRHDGQSR